MQSVSLRSIHGWTMPGMFLIPAGLSHATSTISAKPCSVFVCLGNESQFELVNSGLCLRKIVILSVEEERLWE